MSKLAGVDRCGIAQLRIGGIPDRSQAASSAEKQGRGSESDKGDEQSVLNQVLPVVTFEEFHKPTHDLARLGL